MPDSHWQVQVKPNQPPVARKDLKTNFPLPVRPSTLRSSLSLSPSQVHKTLHHPVPASSLSFDSAFFYSPLLRPLLTIVLQPSVTMADSAKSTGSTKLDAAVQNIKAAEPAKLSGVGLYSRFALAGAVCCSVTHGALTPVDVYVSSHLKTHFLPFVVSGEMFAVEEEE